MKKSSAQGAEDPILQWVTFRLDNETYGINVMQVQEVLRYTEIAPVPGAPSYVLGIINLRGNVVTVIDTRQRFGLDSSDVTDNTRSRLQVIAGIVQREHPTVRGLLHRLAGARGHRQLTPRGWQRLRAAVQLERGAFRSLHRQRAKALAAVRGQ